MYNNVTINNMLHTQGCVNVVSEDGYWEIKTIHLGATRHGLYFNIFDGTKKMIAKSQSMQVTKIAD